MNSSEGTIRFLTLKVELAIAVLMTMDFWSHFGKACASIYSIAVLGEWIWKKWIKPRWFKDDEAPKDNPPF
ncbi:MAG: hypothetical protein ACSLE9_14455 [Burkholderiaceae bacterium]